MTRYNKNCLYALYHRYLTGGPESITENHCKGNRRDMTYEEERVFLARRAYHRYVSDQGSQ